MTSDHDSSGKIYIFHYSKNHGIDRKYVNMTKDPFMIGFNGFSIGVCDISTSVPNRHPYNQKKTLTEGNQNCLEDPTVQRMYFEGKKVVTYLFPPTEVPL